MLDQAQIDGFKDGSKEPMRGEIAPKTEENEMTTKHTPRPWLFDEGRDAITTHNRITNGETRIATVELGWAEPLESEQIANARLIAAAPDLLEALGALLERYALAIGNEGIECYQARAAIAKATGEQP
jgi:hypothetical protein